MRRPWKIGPRGGRKVEIQVKREYNGFSVGKDEPKDRPGRFPGRKLIGHLTNGGSDGTT
jgi:hypothetical protein